MPPLSSADLARAAPNGLRPITVDEYHAMGRAGVFRPDERVELLDGHLLPMSPIGNAHFVVTNQLGYLLGRACYQETPPLAVVSAQGPVRLDDRSEPEPDLALLQPDVLTRGRIARADDVLLIVEVSDTTLAFDRGPKRARYAAAGIPEVWVVSTKGRYVEVARQAEGDEYTEIRRVGAAGGGSLVPLLLPRLAPLDVGDVFAGLAD
jgi:Uma2 family endonuclease